MLGRTLNSQNRVARQHTNIMTTKTSSHPLSSSYSPSACLQQNFQQKVKVAMFLHLQLSCIHFIIGPPLGKAYRNGCKTISVQAGKERRESHLEVMSSGAMTTTCYPANKLE